MTYHKERKTRVRFAPSPTGNLHVGGARTAIFNWAFARATHGDFILRIEDTDTQRSTDEHVQTILNSLRWLGLDWDEGPDKPTSCGPYFQTQRSDTYVQALERLKARASVYPCFCSKETLDQKRLLAQAQQGGSSGYDRTCRNLDSALAAQRIQEGETPVWRLRVPDNHGPLVFNDAVYGNVSFPAEVMDDMILMRSDATPTYNFAVVCDDANMGITHVIRGDDHLSNTPRQMLIYEALGYEIPQFAHLSMILGSDGKKLSKRHGAASVEEFRDQGYLSDTLVNFLALLGWSYDGQTTIIDRETLAHAFSLKRVTKKDAVFDEVKLNWMNGHYIANMGAKKWVELARPWLASLAPTTNDIESRPAFYEALYPLVAQRLVRLDEIPAKLSFMFWGSNVNLDDTSVEKVLKKEGSRADEALTLCLNILADTHRSWEAQTLQEACKLAGEQHQLKPKALFQPLRVAITGSMVSPPLFESIELLLRDDVIARIKSTLKEIFSD